MLTYEVSRDLRIIPEVIAGTRDAVAMQALCPHSMSVLEAWKGYAHMGLEGWYFV
jgi:hypothetical protein